MTFPRISTKATNISLSPHIENLLEQKLAPLGRFFGEGEGDIYCEAEFERVAEHQSGKIFRVEVNLRVKGRLFRVEATEEQIEQAIDQVRDELKHELQHVYGKRRSLVRRGAQALKNMLRFGKGE